MYFSFTVERSASDKLESIGLDYSRFREQNKRVYR